MLWRVVFSFCFPMWKITESRKTIIIIIAKQWAKIFPQKENENLFCIFFFARHEKKQQWKHGTENLVIIVINSGILKQHERGENWQYYSLERIYFYFFSPSSLLPRLLPRLFGLIHLRRNAKSKPSDKIHVVCFFLVFFFSNLKSPTPPSRVSSLGIHRWFRIFICFGFKKRKQFQLFQVP